VFASRSRSQPVGPYLLLVFLALSIQFYVPTRYSSAAGSLPARTAYFASVWVSFFPLPVSYRRLLCRRRFSSPIRCWPLVPVPRTTRSVSPGTRPACFTFLHAVPCSRDFYTRESVHPSIPFCPGQANAEINFHPVRFQLWIFRLVRILAGGFLALFLSHRIKGSRFSSSCCTLVVVRGFLVLVALLWLFFEHVRKVFGEICKRQ
jgi:hypothetical protein